MDEDNTLSLCFGKGLALRTRSGFDLTPRGAKDFALLIMLVFSPLSYQTRDVLRKVLWADRFDAQANDSLRRSLANIRKSFGPYRDILGSNRKAVWLNQKVEIAIPSNHETYDMLRSELGLRESAFDGWLEDHLAATLQSRDVDMIRVAHIPKQEKLRVEIVVDSKFGTRAEVFLIDEVAGQLANLINNIGGAQAFLVNSQILDIERPGGQRHARIELSSVFTANRVLVNAKVLPRMSGLCSWAGRASIDPNKYTGNDQAELNAFVGQIVSALSNGLARSGNTSLFQTIQNASTMLFSGDKSAIRRAGELLDSLSEDDNAGIVLAWKSFVHLTNVLELGNGDPVVRETALALTNEAVVKSPDNPVVRALAAQIHVKLNADFDYGDFLASEALRIHDEDPYALFASSQTSLYQGQFENSLKYAEKAQKVAYHYANAASWDMQYCLALLGVGNLGRAQKMALSAHLKAPSFRPALRYLAALGLLSGDQLTVERAVDALSQLEPQFSLRDLLAPDYPLDTLRRLGWHDQLRSKLEQFT